MKVADFSLYKDALDVGVGSITTAAADSFGKRDGTVNKLFITADATITTLSGPSQNLVKLRRVEFLKLER